jgi:hypothetical protein
MVEDRYADLDLSGARRERAGSGCVRVRRRLALVDCAVVVRSVRPLDGGSFVLLPTDR